MKGSKWNFKGWKYLWKDTALTKARFHKLIFQCHLWFTSLAPIKDSHVNIFHIAMSKALMYSVLHRKPDYSSDCNSLVWTPDFNSRQNLIHLLSAAAVSALSFVTVHDAIMNYSGNLFENLGSTYSSYVPGYSIEFRYLSVTPTRKIFCFSTFFLW